MTKFLGSKLVTLVASGLVFVILWGVIGEVGWSGAEPDQGNDAVAASEPAAGVPATPPAPQEQTIIRRTHVVGRIQEGSAAPPPQPELKTPQQIQDEFLHRQQEQQQQQPQPPPQ